MIEAALDVLRLALAIERLMRDGTRFLHREKPLAEFGLTNSTQILVMAALRRVAGPTWTQSRGLTPNEISAATGVARSTVAMQLKILAKGGLVELAKPGEHAESHVDGRERRYQLTASGSSAAEAVQQRAIHLSRAMLVYLSGKQEDEWFRSLRALLSAVSPHDVNVSFEAFMHTAEAARREQRRKR